MEAPADCTIACEEGHLTAHKLVLCDHSKYLQDILSKFPTAEHPIIILNELNIRDIRILVNYMYTGELVITSDSSPTSLLRAAQILKIDSLTDDDHHQQQQNPNSQKQQQPSSNHHPSDELDDDDNDDDERLEDERLTDDFELDEEPSDHLPHHNNNHNNHHRLPHHHNQRRHHHHNQMVVNDDDDAMDDEMGEMDGDEIDRDRDEDEEDEDEDDDNNNNNRHDNNNSHNSTTSRLINSIRNIYNLQFIDQSQQQQLPLSLSGLNGTGGLGAVGLSLNGENTTTSSKSDFESNPITSNHHLDLDELQDSRGPGSLDNKNNKIRCHLCNIGLSDVKCLYRHVLTRHLPEKWGYKCEFCDREFSRDDHLMRHYTTKHKNMEFNREKIRETRRLNREMAKNFHDQISTA